MRRALALDVTAGTEIQFFAIRQRDDEFLDEAGNVAVRYNGAFPALDAEYLVGHTDLHVLFYRDLAGEAVMVGGIALVDDGRLGRQDCTATREHAHAALAAGATAAARRRDEQLVVGQALHEFAADGYGQFQLVVDYDLDVACLHELRAGREDDEDEYQYDGRKQADAQKYFLKNSGVDVHFRFPRSP